MLVTGESERREEGGRRVTTYVDNIPAERRLRYLHVNHGLVSWSEVRGPNVTVGYTTPDTRVSQIVQVLSTHQPCQASQHQTFSHLEEY